MAAALAVSVLWLYWPGSTLSREQAIEAALQMPSNSRLPANGVTGAKLIHRFDLVKVIEQDGAGDAKPFDRVWVVVVKGDLFPSGAMPPVTYTLEVIRDNKPARVELYYGGGPGARPTHWDELVDLESH